MPSAKMGASIFIVSGEESGDLHGASLISELRRIDPGLKAAGMGGERMRRAGLTGLDSREVSVVGIIEVAGRLPSILRTFRGLKARLREGGFDAVVLIDFPDFNLRIAREAKRLDIPVVYYISPQVWAWRGGRVKKIARLVDKMLVVFPFEEEIYRKAGVDVEYVGHPLAEVAGFEMTREEARRDLGLQKDAPCVALLPGSRTGEIKRLLPGMLKAGELIEKGLGKKTSFLLPAASSIPPGLIDGFLKDSPIGVKAVRGMMYAALRASDAAIVASGTATLETSLIGTPMVIVYRMAPLSYAIGKALVGVKNVGLPNIVAGRIVVPELLQDEASPENMAREALEMLTGGDRRDGILKGYAEIKKRLGEGGAARRAAEAVYGVIARKKA